jgi:hypothetical protein
MDRYGAVAGKWWVRASQAVTVWVSRTVEIGRTDGDADQRVWGRQVEDGVAVVVQ